MRGLMIAALALLVTGCATLSLGDLENLKTNSPKIEYRDYSFEIMNDARFPHRVFLPNGNSLWVDVDSMKHISKKTAAGESKFNVSFYLQIKGKNAVWEIPLQADCNTDAHQIKNTVDILATAEGSRVKTLGTLSRVSASTLGYVVTPDEQGYTQPNPTMQGSVGWYIKQMACPK